MIYYKSTSNARWIGRKDLAIFNFPLKKGLCRNRCKQNSMNLIKSVTFL